MEQSTLETLLDWVRSCPALTGCTWSVDELAPDGGAAGAYPQGVRVLARHTDLLGTVTDRCRLTLVLRLTLPFVPGDAALAAHNAGRLLDFQQWAAQESAAHRAPTLGNADAADEVITAAAGCCEQLHDEGTARYRVTLTAEYTMKWRDTDEN